MQYLPKSTAANIYECWVFPGSDSITVAKFDHWHRQETNAKATADRTGTDMKWFSRVLKRRVQDWFAAP